MLIPKNLTVLEVVRGVRTFLHPVARVARNGTSEPGARTAAPRPPGVPARTSALASKPKQALRQIAEKSQALARGARSRLNGGEAGGIKAENVIWIFGSGRTGSTWLSSMMREMRGQTVWREPLVGALFGEFYYVRAEDHIGKPNKHFILGGAYKETWLKPMRDLILGGAAARFPRLTKGGYLAIKEPNGSIGAPLLMEALPESRMILLVRDPRDVVASSMDARREGSWLYENKIKGVERRESRLDRPDRDSDAYASMRATLYLRYVGNAKRAYDTHKGHKVLLKYEDLRVDTLGTMKRMYAALGIPSDDEELARAVEKYSWENIPEEEKGEGKFYRKATPGAWREDLTPKQVQIVEGITAPLLQELYPGWKREKRLTLEGAGRTGKG